MMRETKQNTKPTVAPASGYNDHPAPSGRGGGHTGPTRSRRQVIIVPYVETEDGYVKIEAHPRLVEILVAEKIPFKIVDDLLYANASYKVIVMRKHYLEYLKDFCRETEKLLLCF